VISLFLYKYSSERARNLGEAGAKLEISANELISEVLINYREAIVRNTRSSYANEFRQNRMKSANYAAEAAFIPNISKYVLESSVVLGAILLSAIQFILQDARHAVAILAIFLAAGTRLAPAILRIQQGLILIKGASGPASRTLDLADDVSKSKVTPLSDPKKALGSHEGFIGDISFSDVTFSYPGTRRPALSTASLSIKSGDFVAFVGPSGAGKTTLVDLLLGVLSPSHGEILISGFSPGDAIENFPGAIAYVPQDVAIAIGTVRENICLGFPVSFASELIVEKSLALANLDAFISGLPNGVDTEVGERGAKLSGGQRQRLGIARALFTSPKMLVLDEATSSLDSETEAAIGDAIQSLRGGTTILMIAHRLASVRSADLVVYIDEGKILAQGKFETVRGLVPDFDRQAKLLGL
jgi:ABC-type multidrug transport system fused ATPase/permease subunit